jgi:cardiolipin synthase
MSSAFLGVERREERRERGVGDGSHRRQGTTQRGRARLNLPNIITLGRLLSVPVVIYLILSDEMLGAFGIFMLAGISDAVDGFIAKNYGQRTELGALLDPIADKTLLVAIYVTLGVANRLPYWLVILVVFRDLLIIGGFLLLKMLVANFGARPIFISKLNTGLQIGLAGIVLARLGLGFDDHGLGALLIWAVAATTVASGAAYLVRWARAFAGAEEAN